ncbi:MAG: helix-turn-helix transcriptional regulator [Hyphomicrobiales bacterium]|nr:helix-turn-helix transcriptional regulator [Hyphomicrobiales bacterium]MCP5371307.1 helix-turn-helix transcriptional regulator [Hyphomicrobiales bacterium]
MQAPAGRPRRRRVEEKERRIIAAARAEFRRHGFDKARIAEIARRVGVAEGTVYLYFANKNALLLAVAAEIYDGLTREAAAGVEEIADTRGRLAFLARLHFRRLLREWRLLVMAMTPYKMADDYGSTEGYRLNRAYVRVFDLVIRDGVNRGEIRADLPLGVMRDMFYGGLEYAVRTHRLRPAGSDPDPMLDHFLGAFAAGIMARPAAAGAAREAEPVTRRLEEVAARLEAMLR